MPLTGKSRPESIQHGAPSAALDELYAANLDRFVALRKELVAKLRAGGDVPSARLLAAAEKPTRTAWALNQIARRHPELMTAVFEARDHAAAILAGASPDRARDRAQRFREAVAAVVRATRALSNDAGMTLSAIQVRSIGETIQALAAEESGRAKLLEARLTQDVPLDDPFAGLTPGPPREAAGETTATAQGRRLEADPGASRHKHE